MAGFIQDPIQFVNLIADNLRDRYPLVPDEPGGPPSGFSLFKELVQNTDDAKATRLGFGRSAGLVNATHPLLRAPALFFVNNGRFKASDARSIRSFGQNSKAADQGSIGKFGLGMKSVFHFCEAFFFLAHDGERDYAEVLNPWSGADTAQSLHQDWDAFAPQDALAIRHHLSSVIATLGDSANPFILWIPLRRQSDLGDAGPILTQYPGKDPSLLNFLAGANFPVRTAALLPMLQSLSRVSYWNLEADPNAREPVFEVALDDAAQRPTRGDWPVDHSTDRRSLTGHIAIRHGDTTQSLHFSGWEAHTWTAALTELHGHQHWPSSYVRNEKGYASEAKDKAKPHGAVLFSRTPGRGWLFTHWTVFLPLDEIEAVERIRCEGDDDVRLTLHGYFFVDAGRQGVDGLEDCNGRALDPGESEAALRRAWNCELLRATVLPLLIPALEAFCTEQELSDAFKTALSQALLHTSLFKRFHADITAQTSWLREITADGVAWVCSGTERRVLSLPAPPPDDPGRAWHLFPVLNSIAKDYRLAVDGAPHLLHPSVKVQWSEPQLLALIESVKARELFPDIKRLDYLSGFLESAAGPYRETLAVRSALADLVRQGLMQLGEEVLERQKKRVSRIVAHLDPSRCCFNVGKGLPSALLRALLSAQTDALPLPDLFFPDTPAGSPTSVRYAAKLSVSDATRFLTKVEEVLGPEADADQALQDEALKLSSVLIKGVADGQRVPLLQRCAELRVLGGFDCRQGRRVPISVQEIRAADTAGLLFGMSEGTTEAKRLGLAIDLQAVLPHDRVLVINKETATLALDGRSGVPPCDAGAVLAALGGRPRRLGGIEKRAALIGHCGTSSNDLETRGLRFLLHADIEHFKDDDRLWVLGLRQEQVWQKLWSQLVGGEAASWNLVDARLTEPLSGTARKAVDLHDISSQSVIDEIERKGLSTLDSTVFDQQECEQILKAVKNDALWVSLPFHWTRQNQAIAGNIANAYLDCGQIDLNTELRRRLHLFVLSDDKALAQRQRDLLRILNAEAAIEIGLHHPEVPGVWRIILDALQALAQSGRSLSATIAQRLKSAEWLPSITGAQLKPDDIIDLDAAEAELESILAKLPGLFATPRALLPDVLAHPAYPQLRQESFARGQAGLRQLGLVLSEIADYRLGSIELKTATELEEAARVLGGYSHAGWQLLAVLIERLGAHDCFQSLLPSMQGPVKTGDLVALLNWITDQSGDRQILRRVFDRYLKAFAGQKDAREALGRLKLRNKDGYWKPSKQLASGVTGVAASHVLDAQQAEILSGCIVSDQTDTSASRRDVAYASQTASAGPILRGYFDPWTVRVARPLVGVLILLCGNDPSLRDLCQDLLHPRSRDKLIAELPWNVQKSDPTQPRRAWLEGLTLPQALDYLRMAVRVHDGEQMRVRSLLGAPILVSLDHQVTTVFLDRPSYFSLQDRDGYKVELVLRRIPIKDYSDSQLSEILRASVSYLLREVYNQRGVNLESLWEELDQSDQVDIELAKALILDHVPVHLKYLGAHKHPAIRAATEQYREQEMREKEFAGKPQQEHQYRQKKVEALKRLQTLIETDASAQQAILENVKRKVMDFQYQAQSVPFELFQNADDALRDLEHIDAFPAQPGDSGVDPLPDGIRRFVVECDAEALVFMHWGRAINQFGTKGYPGRERGFDRDLENMLILSGSDKDEDATGKFGLGFKSVWLVTERPTIVSGRLQASIVGGILPVPNRGELSQTLVARLAEHQPDRRWPGTAVHLPLTGVSGADVLARFPAVAGTMVAFARSLRRIDIRHPNGTQISVNWVAEPLPNCAGIELGRVRQDNGDPLRVMKLRLDEGALLLPLGPRGFTELPKSIPHVWVTAPLSQDERLGFAINAMFEVDAGRSQLSKSGEKNRELASRLGEQFAERLAALREAMASDWEAIRSVMGLPSELDVYDLWHSLWQVLLARVPQLERDSGSRVVAEALLSSALAELSRHHLIVPNGLPDGLRHLMRWTEAATVLKGALSEQDVLRAVVSAPCFQGKLDPRSCVSAELATWLRVLVKELGERRDLLHSVSLADLFHRLDANQPIRPEDARALGKALHPETAEQWRKRDAEVPKETLKDLERMQEKAGQLRFVSAAGEAVPVKRLLGEGCSEEETRRWRFAPAAHRLADGYDEPGIAFFRLCRGQLEAPADRLKDWMLNAADSASRQAALRYLLEGALAQEVIQKLRAVGLTGTWLAEISEDDPLIKDWDQDQCWWLVYQILKTPEESKVAHSRDAPIDPTPLPKLDPKQALTAIHDWWLANRDAYLLDYHDRVYPGGSLPSLHEDDCGAIDRSSWLLLLLLGGFHTMGRTQPEQHRNFIELCRHRDWWDVFTAPDPTEHFKDWMDVLDQYIDAQMDEQKYEQWMMRFPIIYKLARHLDDYAELFLGLKQRRERFDLGLVQTPNADPDQQGGGISAAALPKTLGKGANFVVRELIRLGVISDDPHVREHAFVPYAGVLDLLWELGCTDIEHLPPLRQAPQISAFVHQHLNDPEQATFCRDFDIPLRIIADKPQLQWELLGRPLSRDTSQGHD